MKEFRIMSYLLGMHMHELSLAVLRLLFVFFPQFLKFIFQPLYSEFYINNLYYSKYFHFIFKSFVMTPLKILQP